MLQPTPDTANVKVVIEGVIEADYEVVDVIETGAGAHMAAVTPDDSAVWVANIGARTFTEITLDVKH